MALRISCFARLATFEADDLQPFGTSALQESLVPGFGRTLNTSTRNAVASHTRVLGNSKLNEIRVSWMKVTGGQIGLNDGNPFASQVGLQGVSTDPRDAGFPQISTGGFFSTMGDPTVNTTRETQHFELFENFTWDRGKHRLKLGTYYYHLNLQPVQADNARGAFTYTGQFSGNAFSDFLLGYPTTAVSGIGRGDENGRSNWLHLFPDDWQARDISRSIGRVRYNRKCPTWTTVVPMTWPRAFVIASATTTRPPSPKRWAPCSRFRKSVQSGDGVLPARPSAVRWAAPRLRVRSTLRRGYTADTALLNQWALRADAFAATWSSF